MDITFALRGVQGYVTVTYARNDHPELVGASAEPSGFPICDATVDYPARGYDALLGWVQLVRSDDNTSHGDAFEIDPLDILGDVPHPFCWIGLAPHLFDAPSRAAPRRDLDWIAHSFLCVSEGSSEAGLEVDALLGFAWGFRIRDQEIELVPPTLVAPERWDQHVSVLEARYPAWRFARGFRDG